jgi:hypothetical protein
VRTKSDPLQNEEISDLAPAACFAHISPPVSVHVQKHVRTEEAKNRNVLFIPFIFQQFHSNVGHWLCITFVRR